MGHFLSMPEVNLGLNKVIHVIGPDRTDFLQSQLTQDISILSDSEANFSAWCNVKGRVITTLSLFKLDDRIVMIVPSSMTEIIIKKLIFYRFRSKVDFLVTDENPNNLSVKIDLNPEKLISRGIPIIDSTNTETYTPHMLNLDKLEAISFNKGCYTGQEIIARTEHLGKSKRRMMLYKARNNKINIGSKLFFNEKNAGIVVNACGNLILAVTPTKIHTETLTTLDDIKCSPRSLPYEI